MDLRICSITLLTGNCQLLILKFTDTDLTSFISKIDDAETEFVVLDPMEIKCKFLTISCSNVSLAIPITCRFEFD